MRKSQKQLQLENAKIYSVPFATMLQAVPADAIILQEVPAFFFATDYGNYYKMYRFFSNKQVPHRIIEVGIIPKAQKEGDIYVF